MQLLNLFLRKCSLPSICFRVIPFDFDFQGSVWSFTQSHHVPYYIIMLLKLLIYQLHRKYHLKLHYIAHSTYDNETLTVNKLCCAYQNEHNILTTFDLQHT